MRALGWGLRLALAGLFAFAASGKLLGHAESVAAFTTLGAGSGFRLFIGGCELLGAIGLVLPPFAALAALALSLVMIGAVAAHLLVLGPSAAPAAVVLAALLAVAWLERGGLRALHVLVTGKGAMDGWLAHSYDRGIQQVFRGLFTELSRDVLAAMQGARRILDAGCGPGQFTVMAAEALPRTEVWGIDLAPAMLALARQHAAASPAVARVHFERADVTRLPFPDAHFDAVMTTGSIKQWPDPVAGLCELHRVLVPGGRAFVVELNRAAPPAAVAAFVARAGTWVARVFLPRAVAQGMAPADGVAIVRASPFGTVVGERLLLDGLLWLAELQRAPAHDPPRVPAPPG